MIGLEWVPGVPLDATPRRPKELVKHGPIHRCSLTPSPARVPGRRSVPSETATTADILAARLTDPALAFGGYPMQTAV
jgi:hypothetical protein